jgi:hypothetical protein
MNIHTNFLQTLSADGVESLSDNDSGISKKNQLVMSWLADQIVCFRTVTIITDYLKSEFNIDNMDKQVCTIQNNDNLQGFLKAVSFYSNPTILCNQVSSGASETPAAVESLKDVIQTKELVYAICTLFITIIAMVWLQSSWIKFENENRSLPFHHHFICNDIDLSSIDLWCHFLSHYASILLIFWTLFKFMLNSLTAFAKWVFSKHISDTKQGMDLLNIDRHIQKIMLVTGKKSSESFVLMKRITLIVVAIIIFALG